MTKQEQLTKLSALLDSMRSITEFERNRRTAGADASTPEWQAAFDADFLERQLHTEKSVKVSQAIAFLYEQINLEYALSLLSAGEIE